MCIRREIREYGQCVIALYLQKLCVISFLSSRKSIFKNIRVMSFLRSRKDIFKNICVISFLSSRKDIF